MYVLTLVMYTQLESGHMIEIHAYIRIHTVHYRLEHLVSVAVFMVIIHCTVLICVR